jgi:hypothetical protein
MRLVAKTAYAALGRFESLNALPNRTLFCYRPSHLLGRKTKNDSVFYLVSWTDGFMPTWIRASDVSPALQEAYQETIKMHQRRSR